jgi:hypothetical protein
MRGHVLMTTDGVLRRVILFIEKTNTYICKSGSYINATAVPKNNVIAMVNPKDFSSYEEIMDHFEIINKLQNLNLAIRADLGHPDEFSTIWWGKDLEEAVKSLQTPKN